MTHSKRIRKAMHGRMMRLMTTSCVIALAAPAMGHAQQDEAYRTIDVITVTAQKRTERLQDVPLSIRAITETEIRNLGISQFEDIVAFAPSVSFVSERPGT